MRGFIALAAICILLGFWGSFAFKHPSLGKDHANRDSTAPESVPLDLKPIRKLQNIPLALASPSANSVAGSRELKELREKGIIEVRAVHGLAIAQGDILLGKLTDAEPALRGQAQVPEVRFWESPEIPYAIDASILDGQKQKIEAAISYLRDYTPVHFIPYSGQLDAIIFEKGSEHCISALGKIGGLQPIRLDLECGTHEILHEILHALGFPHEQARSDRDANVEILWTNIDEKYQDQFQMVPDVWMLALRESPFDLESIMIYPPEIFQTHPGLPTMRSLSNAPIAPVREGLSTQDKERLKRLFRVN